MRLLSHEDGIRTYVKSDGTNWEFKYEFDDVSTDLDYTADLRNNPDTWRNGVKNELVHYCHIPPSILLKWHFDGVNINNARELVNMVNRPEWRYLKCVDKVHVAKE